MMQVINRRRRAVCSVERRKTPGRRSKPSSGPLRTGPSCKRHFLTSPRRTPLRASLAPAVPRPTLTAPPALPILDATPNALSAEPSTPFDIGKDAGVGFARDCAHTAPTPADIDSDSNKLIKTAVLALSSIWLDSDFNNTGCCNSPHGTDWFIREILRRTKTSQSTLQLALLYLHRCRHDLRAILTGFMATKDKLDYAKLMRSAYLIKNNRAAEADYSEEVLSDVLYTYDCDFLSLPQIDDASLRVNDAYPTPHPSPAVTHPATPAGSTVDEAHAAHMFEAPQPSWPAATATATVGAPVGATALFAGAADATHTSQSSGLSESGTESGQEPCTERPVGTHSDAQARAQRTCGASSVGHVDCRLGLAAIAAASTHAHSPADLSTAAAPTPAAAPSPLTGGYSTPDTQDFDSAAECDSPATTVQSTPHTSGKLDVKEVSRQLDVLASQPPRDEGGEEKEIIIQHEPNMPREAFDGPYNLALLCGRRSFLGLLLVAAKVNQDRHYNNAAWSKLSGLELEDINNIERSILGMLDYQLIVPNSIFSEWVRRLQTL